MDNVDSLLKELDAQYDTKSTLLTLTIQGLENMLGEISIEDQTNYSERLGKIKKDMADLEGTGDMVNERNEINEVTVA